VLSDNELSDEILEEIKKVKKADRLKEELMAL
jgi:hypothetical protein